MRKLKEKNCSECGTLYMPTGSCSKYCPTCRPIVTKRITDAGIKRWQYAKGYLNGKGSGSATGKGKDNHMYTYGVANFRQYAQHRKDTVGLCELCGKDIKNNDISNLLLICKRCHQIEHKCWKAFEGVTTREQSRRADNSSKPPTPEMDDDIVCST
jgi:hypothetical protein